MAYVFTLLLVSLALAEQTIGSYNAGLDPAPLKWWQTKWCSNPVELGMTNKGLTTTVTFNISPSTTVTSGVLEVTFPAGFDVTSASCSHVTSCTTTITSQLVSLPSITIKAGSDYSFTIADVILPTSPGGYGPFALRTRHYTGGQTADINLNFATVGISQTRGSLSGVTVATVSSSSKVGATGSTLSFKFQIAKDLWKNDIFRITASQYWTISLTSTCSTAAYTGRINNFNGTRSADPHYLDCYVSPKTTASTAQTIYIYGLNNDIDVSATDDNKYVDLRLSSVTNPDADYADTSYTWTVETIRGQTRTVIESGTTSNGPSTDPGTLVSAAFSPTWGWPASNVLPNHHIYTNFGFTTVNKIAQGGSAIVLYTDTIDVGNYNGNTSAGCWLHNYLTYTSGGTTYTAACTGSGKTATISNLPETVGGTTLTITVVTLFSTTVSEGTASATVTTNNASGLEIDKASGLGGLTLGNSSTNYVPTTFFIGVSNGANLLPNSYLSTVATCLAGETGSTEAIMFKIKPITEGFTSNTQITIKFPFIQASSVQNFEFAIPSGVTYYLQSQASAAAALTTTIASSSLTITPSSTGTATCGANLGTYAFKLVTTPTATHTTYFAARGTTGTQIHLPRYKSNAATRYEAYLETKDTTMRPQLKALQIEIFTNSFASDILNFCDGALDFLPLKAVITPNTVATPDAVSDISYFYEIDFTNSATLSDLGSGLATGNDYPYSLATSTFSSFTITVGTPAYLRAKLSSGIAAGTTTSVLYTVIYSQLATFAPVARGYYTIDADPRNKYQTHQRTTTTVSLSATSGTAIAVTTAQTSTAIAISTAVTTWTEGGLKLALDLANNNSVEWAICYPQGWTLAGATVLDPTPDSVSGVVISPSASSTTRYVFSLTSMLFTETASFAIADLNSIVFKGAVSSSYVLPNAEIIFSLAGTTAWAAACVDYWSSTKVTSAQEYSMTPGSITVTSISPSSVKARGPGSVNLTQAVVFSVPHLIPAGGNIVATVDSSWGVASPAACAVTGLTNQSSTLSVTATLSSSTCTVTQFAEVSANSSITLTFTGLLPPTSTGLINFLSSIVTNFIIVTTPYQIDSSAAVTVTVTASNSTGRSSFVTLTTYPQTALAKDVDLYLKFSLSNSVPKGGVLELSSPLTFKISTNPMDQVWLAPLKYSAVSYSSSLSITLAEDYAAGTTLELFIDKAVDNPSSTTTTSTGFTLKSSWGGVTIDTDISQTLLPAQQFTASAVLTSSLTASTSRSLSFSPTTATEYATYSFIFKSSVKFAAGDQIWVVTPDQFDPYVGTSWPWFSNEATSYYLSCSSSLGTTWCRVDHNIIVVTGSSEVNASTDIVITLFNVKNPAAAKTDLLQLLHTDSNGVAKSYNASFGTVTPTDLPYNVEIRTISASDPDLFDSGSYTFVIYLAETFTTTSQLKVMFPMEYDLSKDDKQDAYSCSTNYQDDSDSATNKTGQTWNANTACPAAYNSITLPSPSSSRIFASTDIVTFTINSVGNPQWGQSRTAETGWDFEATDGDVWTIYDLWTSNFEIFVYNSASAALAYTGRTYGVLSRAYLGFSRSRKQLIVNSYNPQAKNSRIVVFAGSQTSDLLIATESTSKPCSAKKIVFRPSTNSRTSDSGKLVYTSKIHKFILWQNDLSLLFRVAAKASLGKGLYYIDWTIEEFKEDGLIDNAYNRPVKTLVEVVGKTSMKYKFAVSTIPAVAKGGKSTPVKISIDNAPSSDVIISISGSSSDVSISPAAVTFSLDVNFAYFQISVASNSNLTSASVAFALSGTDAAVYSIDAAFSFAVLETSSAVPGSITSWGIGTCTQVSCSVTPSTDQIGTLYWQLSAKGSDILSSEELSSQVGSIITSTNATSAGDLLIQQITKEYIGHETDPVQGETWVEFQHRVYKAHLEDYWIGRDAVLTTTNSFTRDFYWLYAGTKYQISGYLNNGTTVKTEYFSTVAAYDSQPFSVKFKGTVLDSYTSRIAELAAQQQGVNADRLISRASSNSTSRALQSPVTYTTFTMTFATDRSGHDPSPSDQAKIEGSSLSTFKANLKAAGIINEVDSVTNSAIPSKTTPSWSVSPEVESVTTNQVTMTLRASVAGETCCVAVLVSTTSVAPSAEQVYLGLSSTNVEVPSQCISTDTLSTSNSVTISGLETGTDYNVYCSAADSFPVWPTHMIHTDDKINSYSATTSSVDRRDAVQEVDSAKLMSVVLSLLVLAFN
jgi:hypothetical protein